MKRHQTLFAIGIISSSQIIPLVSNADTLTHNTELKGQSNIIDTSDLEQENTESALDNKSDENNNEIVIEEDFEETK